MALAVPTLLSTAGLVTARSAGVAARALSLLTLAAGMPAERFGHYATAVVLSELARCASDFGLDPLVLRRAEGLAPGEQRPIVRAALAIRAVHGAVAAAVVLAVLAALFRLDLLLVAAGLQFVPQGWLQLALNWRQVNNSAQRVAPILILFYSAIAVLAAAAWLHPSLGALPLPLLWGGEAALGVLLLLPVGSTGRCDLRAGYGALAGAALPMAGVALLAFVNTRTDALLVGRLLDPVAAGRYLYLARWIDLAPMLATGVALPLVGKVALLDQRRNAAVFASAGLVLALAPFALVEVAALLRPAYGGDPVLRWLLGAVGTCRIGLAVTTVLLLSRWHDGLLLRIAPAVSLAMPIATWLLGSAIGSRGVAGGVLLVETANLLVQVVLVARSRPRTMRPEP